MFFKTIFFEKGDNGCGRTFFKILLFFVFFPLFSQGVRLCAKAVDYFLIHRCLLSSRVATKELRVLVENCGPKNRAKGKEERRTRMSQEVSKRIGSVGSLL